IGVKVTVIEIAPRILARVCDEHVSARVHETHRRRGVDIRLNTVLSAVTTEPDGRLALVVGDETLIADVVVVGAGAMPDDRIAAAAGLKTDGGIVVDVHCATSDPAIFAAGAVVR